MRMKHENENRKSAGSEEDLQPKLLWTAVLAVFLRFSGKKADEEEYDGKNSETNDRWLHMEADGFFRASADAYQHPSAYV